MNNPIDAELALADAIESRHGDNHDGIRSYLLSRAERDLIVSALRSSSDPDAVVISREAYDAFLKALDNPSEPNEALRRLMRKSARCSSPAETRNEWQPIETAPHETRVLLGWKYDGAWFCETGMASHGWRRNGISTMSWHGQATHWQPLPAPPALTEKRPSNQEVGK